MGRDLDEVLLIINPIGYPFHPYINPGFRWGVKGGSNDPGGQPYTSIGSICRRA